MTSPATSPVSVRATTADDWEVWRHLRLRALQGAPHAFGSTYEREVAFTRDDWRDRTGGAAGHAVLAFAGNEPVGMGGGFRDLPGWLHVVAMWTEPAWRGHGVGTAVLDHLAGWARDHDLRLHLDVEVGNADARRLYERAGFTPTGETRPIREGSPHLVERMVQAETPGTP